MAGDDHSGPDSRCQGPPTRFDPGSRSRLGPCNVAHFPSERLFDRLGRALCEAHCLPRKELFETWAAATRIKRRFGSGRIVELACGHGLLAHALALLLPRGTTALALDRRLPPSAALLRARLIESWPWLEAQVRLEQGDLRKARVELGPEDIVVSLHACGGLTDHVIAQAVEAGARLAVLPCCHQYRKFPRTGLEAWMPRDLAIDVERATRLRLAGYRVWSAEIPAEITPKNRLLLAAPASS